MAQSHSSSMKPEARREVISNPLDSENANEAQEKRREDRETRSFSQGVNGGEGEKKTGVRYQNSWVCDDQTRYEKESWEKC